MWMKNGEPSSKQEYLQITDSAKVLWRKDEKETLKGVKRFEIEQVTSTSWKDGTFCIMVQQLNSLSELNLVRVGETKVKKEKMY